MNRRLPIIPFDSLLAETTDTKPRTASNRTLLNNADVIYAVEAERGRDILIFGREKLQRIAASDVPEGARVLRVGLTSDNCQLDTLLDLVRQAKGFHDYAGPAFPN
jgi:hypothetical protein